MGLHCQLQLRQHQPFQTQKSGLHSPGQEERPTGTAALGSNITKSIGRNFIPLEQPCVFPQAAPNASLSPKQPEAKR